MKRIFISAILLTLVNFNIFAQEPDTADSNSGAESDRWDFIDKISVGANLGFSVPSMIYTGSQYDEYKKSPLFSGIGGLFVDWNFYGNWSFRPHLNFVGRGVNMRYEPLFINYQLRATYFDIRTPIVYSFKTGSGIEPYLSAGPSFNFVTGGRINYVSGAQGQVYEMRLNRNNFKPFDLGLFFGAGFNYPIVISGFRFNVGAELGYNIGLVDTFSKAEKTGQSKAVNIPQYSIDGRRKNHNMSLSVHISIPLRSIFKKRKKETRHTTVQAVTEYVAPTVQERKVTVQEKQCCSLEEMYEMILAGEDISLKKICAFSDITFDFDKAVIRNESKAYLDKFVTILLQYPSLKLSIIGHTDNVGDSQYNLQLSRKRAEAVARYFIEHGIESDRLKCYGYGSRQPLTDNSSAEARALNRRVEFDIVEGSF